MKVNKQQFLSLKKPKLHLKRGPLRNIFKKFPNVSGGWELFFSKSKAFDSLRKKLSCSLNFVEQPELGVFVAFWETKVLLQISVWLQGNECSYCWGWSRNSPCGIVPEVYPSCGDCHSKVGTMVPYSFTHTHKFFFLQTHQNGNLVFPHMGKKFLKPPKTTHHSWRKKRSQPPQTLVNFKFYSVGLVLRRTFGFF